MKNNVNLNKLKEEIDTRKRDRGIISSKMGESVNTAPRDSFLHGLVESLHTGRDTASSVLVKTVDNKVAEKNGEKRKLPISNEHVLVEQNNTTTPIIGNNLDMSQDRDELLFQKFEQNRKKTLAESMADFYPKQPNYMQPNGNQMQTGVPMNLNEAVLGESVKKIVNNYLVENFGAVLDEAINNTILEMYAVERIKAVLHENKDLIRTVVIETIREIQAKNKQKAQ